MTILNDNIERFDIDEAANPFDRRIPKLPDEATDREREIAAKYARISFMVVSDDDEPYGCTPDATVAWLCVGVQSFSIGRHTATREEAAWLCWMLAKALIRLIDDETAQ